MQRSCFGTTSIQHKRKLKAASKFFPHRKIILTDSEYLMAFNNFMVALDHIGELAIDDNFSFFDNFITLLREFKIHLLQPNTKNKTIDDYIDSFLTILANSISIQDKYFRKIKNSKGMKMLYQCLTFCSNINNNDVAGIIKVNKFHNDLLNFGGYDSVFGYETSTQIRLQYLFRCILNCNEQK
jgi:hypothetical protein